MDLASKTNTKLKYQPEVFQNNLISGNLVLENCPELKLETLDRPFYPPDLTLCLFAKQAYQDNNRTLPDDKWKLFMAGKNNKDGYFGAAFWNQEDRHLVISHRGTNSFRALSADLGVVQNKYTSQVHSACTFVFLALSNFNTEKFSISITGHSLGGWLSQITAFAIEYLKVENKYFCRLEKENRKYHPHVVTFDSPGCEEMLCKISKDYFHRKQNQNQNQAHTLISKLDISNYVIAPNVVNSKNGHCGRLLRLNFEVDYSEGIHTLQFHKLENFLHAFRAGCSKLSITNWPQFSIAETLKHFFLNSNMDEYGSFFNYGSKANKFCPVNVDNLNEKSIQVAYGHENFDETIVDYSFFKEDEKMFLKIWKKLKDSKKSQSSEINKFLEENNLGSVDDFFSDFQVLDDKIKCVDRDALETLMSRTKWLFADNPKANEILKKQILNFPSIIQEVYKVLTNNYLQDYSMYDIDFKDNIGIEKFLTSRDHQVMLFRTDNTKDEAFRIYNIVQQIINHKDKFYLFSIRDVEYLEKNVDIADIFESSTDIDKLLIIDFEDVEKSISWDKLYEKIFNGTTKKEKKIICISQNKNFYNSLENSCNIEEAILMDLNEDSLESLLNRKVVSLNGHDLSLIDFAKTDQEKLKSIPLHVLKENNFLFSNQIAKLNFLNEHFKSVFLNTACAKVLKDMEILYFQDLIMEYESTLKPIINKSLTDIKFFITGVSDDSTLKDLTEKFKDQIILNSSNDPDDGSNLFRKICFNNPKLTVFRLHVSQKEHQILTWLDIFDPKLYIPRKFVMKKTEVQEEKLLEIAKNKKIVLIANNPGMGKSTALVNLANKIQKGWVLWINLIDAHKYIEAKSLADMESIITFLFQFSSNNSKIAKTLFQISLEIDNSIPVYIFFDAFDEIKDMNLKDKVLEILKKLKEDTLAQIFISTRIYDCKPLEMNLSTIAVKLTEIIEKEQIEFCKKFWTSTLSLVGCHSREWIKRLEEYSQNVMKSISIAKPTFTILGIPLQLRMITEIFQPEDAENFSHEKLDLNLNLYKLYSSFETKKYEIFFKEKMCFSSATEEFINLVSDGFKMQHRILGIKHLFPNIIQSTDSIDLLRFTEFNRVGIVQMYDDGISFVHLTFADYFAAVMLVNWMENQPNDKIKELIVKTILPKFQYFMIRRFMNDIFLEREKEGTIAELDKKIFYFLPEIWKNAKLCTMCRSSNNFHQECKYIILHTLVKENNSKLIKLILDNFENSDDLKSELLGAKDLSENSVLHTAIEKQRINIAFILLKYKPDLCIKNNGGNTCLHLAAIYESFQSFFFQLLDHDANADVKNNSKQNPLDVAFKNQNWDLLLEYFKKHKNQSFLKDWGTKLIYIAAENKRDEEAIQLIEEGCGFNLEDNECYFLEYGRWNLTKMLIEVKKIAGHEKSETELAIEIFKTKVDIWDLVIKHDDVNIKNEKDQTFLHFAVGQKRIDIVNILIGKGAEINAVDLSKKTPIYLAAVDKNWNFIDTQFKKIDFKILGPNKENLVHIACEQDCSEVALRILREGKVDKNSIDKKGNTPLLIAASQGYWRLVTDLIGEKADVHVVNKNKETILHFVCQRNQSKLAKELIEKHKVELNVTDNNQKTPLFLAAENRNWCLVYDLISNFRANPDIPDSTDRTVLQLAQGDDRSDVVKIIRSFSF